MKTLHVLSLTVLALTAFAANSILARLALTDTGIDPVSFTTIRIVSGALILWLIVRFRIRTTAVNFMRASLPALLVSAIFITRANIDLPGILLAITSGALASGLGYVIWYAALKQLHTSTAAVSQLSVPVITAILGILLLAEPLTPRLLVAGLAIVTGIALVTFFSRMKPSEVDSYLGVVLTGSGMTRPRCGLARFLAIR